MRGNFRKRLLCTLLAAMLAVGSALPASAVSFEKDNRFSDVKSTDWFAAAVTYCAANGLVNGTSTTTYSPNGRVTRREIAQVLWNRENKPGVDAQNKFTDVPAGQWYTNSVVWCSQNGIVTGTSATTFAPGRNVTRQDICTMVYRYVKDYLNQSVSLASEQEMAKFADWGRVSSYAKEAVRWAINAGFMKGTSATTISPSNTASRMELAQFLMNLDSIFGKDVTVEMPVAPANRAKQLVKYIQTNGAVDKDGDSYIGYNYPYDGFSATAEVLVQDQGNTLMFWQVNEYEEDITDMQRMVDSIAFWYYVDEKETSEIQYRITIGEDEEMYTAEIIPASYQSDTYLQFYNYNTGERPDENFDDLMQVVSREAFLHWQDVLQDAGFSLADIGFTLY